MTLISPVSQMKCPDFSNYHLQNQDIINQVLLNARERDVTRVLSSKTVNIPGPKQSIKITDRFDCTSTNVIYCITCNLCKMLYTGEAGRRLGDRFHEHLKTTTKMHLNPFRNILIFPAIHWTAWLSAEFSFVKATLKAATKSRKKQQQ